MSDPRILFVDHAAVLGGGELSLLDIADAYKSHGSVALFEDGPFRQALESRGVRVQILGEGAALRTVRKGSALPAVGALVGTIRTARALRRAATQCDVLYANSPKSMIVAALASIGSTARVVWHLRDILSREHFSALNIRVCVLMANHLVWRVTANSQATADAFVAAGGDAQRLRVVHNGIDAAPFSALDAGSRARTRAAHGIPVEAFVVGCFSRLHPWKGQHVLLDALEQSPSVHALLVGGALFSGESAFEELLRSRASVAPLAGRVHMTGMRSDVPALMAACDVIAHTSVLPEPFGRVLVEAMLSRRPLIATDAGGVQEVVQHGVTGLLVPAGDAAALARAIERLRDDTDLGASLADAGDAHARRHFTRERMLAGVDAVLREGRAVQS